VTGVALLLALGLAAPIGAPTGWDGTNPFRCELQGAGSEAVGPVPGADPYCVEFDKTRQNVSELGVAEFLSLEPARVAAAVPKCFYFQADHWRASVVQDDGATKLYEWDGHYFFDKARGNGGAWVTNFNVNGRTFDPSSLPGIPPEFARHLGPGTGGVISRNAIPADPACAARAEADPEAIYASAPAEGSSCVATAGPVARRRLGPVALGTTDADLRAALGAPRVVRRGFLRWCADGGGTLLVGQPHDRSGELGSDPEAPAVLVASTAPALLAAAPPRRRAKPVLRAGRTRVVRLRGGALAGVRRGQVRFVAAQRLPSRKALRRALQRAGLIA
jgi:hypothetical protein